MKKETEKVLEQVRGFLEEGIKEARISICLDKVGEDEFRIRYDDASIGALLIMLASDGRLNEIAKLALIKTISDLPYERMEAGIEEFGNLCREAYRDRVGSACEDSLSLLVEYRKSRSVN